MKERRRGCGIAAVAIAALLLATPGSAHAYWSASTTHTGTSTAGISLPAPSSTSCQNLSIILVSVARVSWPAVTGATGYRVIVTRASGGAPQTIDVTSPSIDMSSGVLGDLLTGLLAPTDLVATVHPTFSAGSGIWVSPNSRGHRVRAAVLPIGTTCLGPA